MVELPDTDVIEDAGAIRAPGQSALRYAKQASSAHGEIVPMVRIPADNPIGGTWFNVPITKAGPAVPPNTPATPGSAQIGYWQSPDSVPRNLRIIVQGQISPNALNQNDALAIGLTAKVTYGSPRGNVTIYVPMPCDFELEASYVNVDATYNELPFQLSQVPVTSPIDVNTISFDDHILPYQARCLIIDGNTEDLPPVPLVTLAACTLANNPIYDGPAIIDSALFTNTSSSPVLIVLMDNSARDTQATSIKAAFYVQAQSTSGCGADILGAFQSTFIAYGVAPPLAGALTEDANDADVYVSVWGRVQQ